MINRRFMWMEADKGGSTGGNVGGVEPSADAGTGSTGTPPEPRRFTQAEVDAIIEDRLKREKRKAEEAAEAARQQAAAEAAAKNGEWQKLAEQRERELAQARKEAREAQVRALAVGLGISDPEYAVFLVAKAGENADPQQVLTEYAAKNPPANNAPASSTPTQQAAGSQSPTAPATSGQTFTRSQLRDPAFFQANKAAIMQAAREGRIKEE